MRHLDNTISGTQNDFAAFSGFTRSSIQPFDELAQVPD